jgi:hypothetical protein
LASQRVQFEGAPGAVWKVDGVVAGSSISGTITKSGMYIAPATEGLHTITAGEPSGGMELRVAVTGFAGTLTHHNDNARTGQNVHESVLDPASVGGGDFGLRFTCPVDGQIYTQPLYAPNVVVRGALHNVVYVGTEKDTVYAFDADANPCRTVWSRSLLAPGETAVPADDVGVEDLSPWIGITSTPVIDARTETIYVETKSKNTALGTYAHRLHALDLRSGAEKLGGPALIAERPGFVALRQLQRAALLLHDGVVYLGFGSHGDIQPYLGWLMGFHARNLKPAFARQFTATEFSPDCTTDCTDCTCNAGAIWHSGGGPSVDSSGFVYVVTGNGTVDGVANFGQAALKLDVTGSRVTVRDWFSPFQATFLNSLDIDLGVGSLIVLPDGRGPRVHPDLGVIPSKHGWIYVVDRNDMGHSGSTTDNIVQTINASENCDPLPEVWTPGVIPPTCTAERLMWGQPAYWNEGLYVITAGTALKLFKRQPTGLFSTAPDFKGANTFSGLDSAGNSGATPTVSANGRRGGVVWLLDTVGWSTGENAVLWAYDATNLRTLYTNADAGPAVKYQVPTVANGRVYIGTGTRLAVYGLSDD